MWRKLYTTGSMGCGHWATWTTSLYDKFNDGHKSAYWQSCDGQTWFGIKLITSEILDLPAFCIDKSKCMTNSTITVMTLKYFLHYWPSLWGILWSLVDHKNIKRHTAHTIVSWPNPKQWVLVHTADLVMIIRQRMYIISIITFDKVWFCKWWQLSFRYIDGLVQETCNTCALAMDLCLSCSNLSIWKLAFGQTWWNATFILLFKNQNLWTNIRY